MKSPQVESTFYDSSQDIFYLLVCLLFFVCVKVLPKICDTTLEQTKQKHMLNVRLRRIRNE